MTDVDSTATGEELVEEVVYPWCRNGELLVFDGSPEALAPYGSDIRCGSRYVCTRNEWSGRRGVIIGVRNGFLWRHDEHDKGARAFKGLNRQEVDGYYGLVLDGTMAMLPGVQRVKRSAKRVDEAQPPSPTTTASFMLPIPTATGKEKCKAPLTTFGPLIKAAGVSSHLPALRIYDATPTVIAGLAEDRGLYAGCRVIIRRGPRAGCIVTVIGVLDGRLYFWCEDFSWPRAFDPIIELAPQDALLLLEDNSVKESDGDSIASIQYPEDTFLFENVEYRVTPSTLWRLYGFLHRHKVQHQAGERLGSHGIIIGSRSSRLYEYNISTGRVHALQGDDALSIRRIHGLVIVGCWCDAIPSSSSVSVPLIVLPKFIKLLAAEHENNAERCMYLDRRRGTTTRIGEGKLHAGTTCRVRYGPRFGSVEVIAGADVDGRLWSIAQADAPQQFCAAPLEVENVTVLGRPLAHLHFDQAAVPWAAVRDRTPLHTLTAGGVVSTDDASVNEWTTFVPSVLGEIVALDSNPQRVVRVFGYAPGRRIVYCSHEAFRSFAQSEVARLSTDPSLVTLSFSPYADAPQGLSLSTVRSLLPDGWTLGTVLGVSGDELWVLNDRLGLAEPLPGSSHVELCTRCYIRVVGWDALRSVPQPFADVTARQIPLPHTALRLDEAPLQRDPNVALIEVDRAALESIGLLPADATAGAVSSTVVIGVCTTSFSDLGIRHLRAASRVRYEPKAAPRVARLRPQYRVGDERTANALPVEVWQHFEHPVWLTVRGHWRGWIFAACDSQSTSSGSSHNALFVPYTPAFLATLKEEVEGSMIQPPSQHLAIPNAISPMWLVTPDLKKHNSLVDSRSDRYPDFDTCELEQSEVRHASDRISKERAKEIRLLFGSLPQNELLDIIDMMLRGFRLELVPGDTLLRACRMLAAVNDIFGQCQVKPPTLAQWHRKCREAVELDEEVSRRQIKREEVERVAHLGCVLATICARLGVRWFSGGFVLGATSLPKQGVDPNEEKGSYELSGTGQLSSSAPLTLRTLIEQTPEEGRYALPRMIDPQSALSDNPVCIALRAACHSTHYPFEYILARGRRVIFDISIAACQRHGLYHGEQYTINRGDAKGSICTVLGVLDGKLWRYDSAGLDAAPFCDDSKTKIIVRHGLRFHGMAVAVRDADPFFYHTVDGTVQAFDVSSSALKPFGVNFGERFSANSGISSSWTHGKVITCIGVLEGKLWVARDWCGAAPFADSPEQFRKTGMTLLYRGDVEALDICRRPLAPRFVQRKAIVHAIAGKYGLRTLDCSRESCAPYGVYPGQFITLTKGYLSGQHGTILGTIQGCLYRLVTGDRLATPFDCSPADFYTSFAPQVLSWGRPPCLDIDVDASPTVSLRHQRFRFTSFSGFIFFFDTRFCACQAKFGFTPGDLITYSHPQRTQGSVKQAVVLGAREGLLWKVDKTDRVATFFPECTTQQELVKLFAVKLVGYDPLSEHDG